MQNLDELITKAKEGRLTPTEIEDVAAALAAAPSHPAAYHLLDVLGRGFADAHERLVASFLAREDDPELARLALQILCSFWGRTETYLGRVRAFLRGAPWDASGEVRLMAISVAGDDLRTHDDPELVSGLATIANETDDVHDLRTAGDRRVGAAARHRPPAGWARRPAAGAERLPRPRPVAGEGAVRRRVARRPVSLRFDRRP